MIKKKKLQIQQLMNIEDIRGRVEKFYKYTMFNIKEKCKQKLGNIKSLIKSITSKLDREEISENMENVFKIR